MTVFERYILFKEKLDIKQGELAKALNKTQSALSQQEAGGKLSIQTIEILRKAYNLNLEWLITGDGNLTNEPKPLIDFERLNQLEKEKERLEDELNALKIKYNRNNEKLIIMQGQVIALQEEVNKLKNAK